MSNIKKKTGIIYRAFNKISGKSYIGQSIQTLKQRKLQHYRTAKNNVHKFANALKCYEPEVWVWEILAEVEVDKLNEYELFFINDLDTYKNGYNSVLCGHHQIPKVRTFEFYCPEFGIIKCTRKELRTNYIGAETTDMSVLYNLTSEKVLAYDKWVLAKNKDRYYELVEHLELTHDVYGTFKLTRKEYKERFGIHKTGLSSLMVGRRKTYDGWRLLENKEKYARPKITLTHEVEGTHCLTSVEFKERFGLTTDGVSHLKNRIRKNHKGWKLAEDN